MTYQYGTALGKEFIGKGASLILGPSVNLHRIPQGGRNFEYISGEDPVLGYELAGPITKGIQDQKVIACAKHWADNAQEMNRFYLSENVPDRTNYEMYYQPF